MLGGRKCGCDLIVDGLLKRQGDRMTDHRAITGAVLSAADYAELMRELDDLRSRHRGEVSQRLRDARDHGSPGDDDDRLAIREDAAFAEARIVQLEHLARFATVVSGEEDVDGVASPGSVVTVVPAPTRARPDATAEAA